MASRFRAKHRLSAAMLISFTFFVTELAVAYRTKSLALMADSFHYMNDLISFAVALTAVMISEREEAPQDLTFGWQRAQTLGAFFNGVFLLALGMSIFFQSIERFISVQQIENVKLMLIMGCVGLTLNIISAAFLHEHHDHGHGHGHCHTTTVISADHHDHTDNDMAIGQGHHSHASHDIDAGRGREIDNTSLGESDMGKKLDVDTDSDIGLELKDSRGAVRQKRSFHTDQFNCAGELTQNADPHDGHRHPIYTEIKGPTRDIGMMGVMIHVISDALNNLGVIAASLIVWFVSSNTRHYADPAVSMGISLMILISALPLVKSSGTILLQSAPPGVNLGDVKHDLEKIPGIESVHELHVWRLDQTKAVASAHVLLSEDSLVDFMHRAQTIRECLHAYGIHSVTLQPELVGLSPGASTYSLPSTASSGTLTADIPSSIKLRRIGSSKLDPLRCQMVCGKGYCEHLMCCTTTNS
ncbi:cation efflux protein [Apodospora peruviana]|uniref:Cation efflux protein n=1 Tax=Apodospora peruviana TaxID=516989 RepID=A0AAE0M4A6_9PEZI|nr:cation efflux protein [Apodospora peruviana]